jgi:CRP/FNR family cyclic AMP-dependent transcriptional regulator
MPQASRLKALRSVPLFEDLADDELGKLDRLLRERSFPAGVEIILEETPGDVAYVLMSGSVKIHLEQADGTEVVLAVLAEGDVVGEMSLLDSLGRSASVSTLEEVTVLWLTRDNLWQCLREMSILTRNLVEMMSRRVRLANTHIETLGALDVSGRVARQLLALSVEYGRLGKAGIVIPMPLTQSDLAAMVGASRVRVNQVMRNYRKRGFVSVNEDRRIVIRDPQALAKRCR